MSSKASDRYHHGDLRATLLREAERMLRAQGLEGLSLRRLAERAGVTAAALYHHFTDKNDLLCALAERGFMELDAIITHASERDVALTPEQRALRFVRAYVGFASEHPEIYELMFGRTLWKAGTPTEALRSVAHATFRRYVEHASAAESGTPRNKRRALRRAQVSWAMLHGLCRLLIDGIYADNADLNGMTEAAAELLSAARR